MKRTCLAVLAASMLAWASPVQAELEVQLEGNIEFETRIFTKDVDTDDLGAQLQQFGSTQDYDHPNINFSGSLDPILILLWDRSKHTVTLNPYVRVDQHDKERTHWDIRQASWIGAFGNWEVRAGFDKVFWGVTESAHLVDIINQDDAVEDTDGEDKLGQPLVSVSYWSEWGTLTGFIMPYFRERTFPGADGRPRGPVEIDTDNPIFTFGDNNWHPDWAVRYNHTFSVMDVALSYFNGVGREPSFVPGLGDEGQPVLRPKYDKIKQVGLELQATLGSWLLKFEGITVDGPEKDRHWAFASGFEYTLYQVFGTGADIGIIAEYLYDSRGEAGPSAAEDDLFIGLRWEGNDTNTTRILAGSIFDLDSSAKLLFVEASRRIGDRWRVTLDARFAVSVPPGDPLFFFRRDDFIQLRIARFF